jgi:hypothetical protein
MLSCSSIGFRSGVSLVYTFRYRCHPSRIEIPAHSDRPTAQVHRNVARADACGRGFISKVRRCRSLDFIHRASNFPFRDETRKVRYRRVSPVAALDNYGLLSRPKTNPQPPQRELVFMPRSRHSVSSPGVPADGRHTAAARRCGCQFTGGAAGTAALSRPRLHPLRATLDHHYEFPGRAAPAAGRIALNK